MGGWGGGRIFLKSRRDIPFNKDLSNEHNFDGIHLAGQYLLERRVVIVIVFCSLYTNVVLLEHECFEN